MKGTLLTLTTGDIASRLNAQLLGRADLVIARVDSIDTVSPNTLTLIRSDKFARLWSTSRAVAAVVAQGIEVLDHEPANRALITVTDADVALTSVLEMLAPPERPAVPGVHPLATVAPSAVIDPAATIGPGCVVGDDARIGPGTVLLANVTVGRAVSIGPACRLHPGVCVYDDSVIGARVILHAGVVIGADGFGYRPSADRRSLVKLPHLGNTVIEDDVEIGANSCVDRARFGSTVIGAGTKIDNLVQIGHNCRVGRSCVICGCTGIAGSVTIGDGVQIGGNCGIADNLTIGAGARIAGKAAVMNDIEPGVTVAGYPAMPGRDYMRILGAMRKAAGLK